MTVESATYISQLNTALPSSSDPKSEGDDHVRLLKSALKATFPNFGAAALAASNTQLDKLVTTFSVASASAGAVTVDASGNVGIGVVPTLGSVEVRAGSPTIALSNSATRYGFAQWNDSISALRIGVDGAFSVVFATQALERMRIDSTGNVIKSVNSSAPALSANQTMVVSLPSDTQLRFSVRAADGVTRTATLTLA